MNTSTATITTTSATTTTPAATPTTTAVRPSLWTPGSWPASSPPSRRPRWS